VPLPAIGQQARHSQLGIALTGSPDGGRIALQVQGNGLDRVTGSNGQDDAGTSDLIPGQGIAAGDLL
jgi:hypothetical protein